MAFSIQSPDVNNIRDHRRKEVFFQQSLTTSERSPPTVSQEKAEKASAGCSRVDRLASPLSKGRNCQDEQGHDGPVIASHYCGLMVSGHGEQSLLLSLCFTSTETTRLIRDTAARMGRGGGIIYLSLHQNDSGIKMGSDESYFYVPLIVRDKVTKQCPQTTFEEKGVPKRNRT